MQRRFESLAFGALLGALAVGSGDAAAQAATVEARLRQLESKAEIRRLLDDYMTLLDSRDWDAYVQLFATDGELDTSKREDGAWRIQRRTVTWDLLAGQGAAPVAN